MPSTLSIWITEMYLKIKGNLKFWKSYLRKDTVILKLDKGNANGVVVVIDTTDYYESLDKFFSFQIQQNPRGLMQIPPLSGGVLYNPTFESDIIIETKFQEKSIKISDQKTRK